MNSSKAPLLAKFLHGALSANSGGGLSDAHRIMDGIPEDQGVAAEKELYELGVTPDMLFALGMLGDEGYTLITETTEPLIAFSILNDIY